MHPIVSLDVWQQLEHLMKIERESLHNASSSRVKWLNHDDISTIERMPLNGVDSHPRISSRLLIKDQSSY